MGNLKVEVSQGNSDRRDEFICESQIAVKYLESKGKRVQPFLSESLPYFNSLSEELQGQVLNRLSFFNEVCSNVVLAGGDLNNPRVMLWHALQSLKFIFPSDLFNYISDESVVEIYDQENIQIFRNLRFFDFTSYTLEDLLCRPWVELFSRVDKVQVGLITEAIRSIYDNKVKTILPMSHIGHNHIIETSSPFKLHVDAVLDYLSPIFNRSHQLVGYIAIETAVLIGDMPTGAEAESKLYEYYSLS